MSASPNTPARRPSREERDLKRQGQTALTWGLPNPTTEAVIVGVALLVRDKLEEGVRQPGAAAQATEIAAQLLDKTTAKTLDPNAVACSRGCSYCCHSVVAVSAPEVFRLVRALRTAAAPVGGMDVASVSTRISGRDGKSLDALLASRSPCPLLLDGECGVYADRPMACRQTFSSSVDACRMFFGGRSSEPPVIGAAANVGLIARSVLLGASSSLGLATGTYELGSALALALASADAEQRWLRGEDVLAGALAVPQSVDMAGSVRRWSGMLIGLTAPQ